jgi:hypothetical protein
MSCPGNKDTKGKKKSYLEVIKYYMYVLVLVVLQFNVMLWSRKSYKTNMKEELSEDIPDPPWERKQKINTSLAE